MAAKETSTANQTLDKWFGNTNFTPPATWEIGLLDEGSVELAGGGYARVELTNNSTNFPAASGKEKKIAVEVTFDVATDDWTEAHYIGCWDGGTLKFKALLVEPVTVPEGIEHTFDANTIIFREI